MMKQRTFEYDLDSYDYYDFEDYAHQLYDEGIRQKDKWYLKNYYKLSYTEMYYVCKWLDKLESEELCNPNSKSKRKSAKI